MTSNQSPTISFENTEYAFAYKSNNELRKARWLFSIMGNPLLVNLGIKLTPLAIKWHIPFTKSILRNTIFKQFVGGESLEKTKPAVSLLGNYDVKVILDYGVEGGEGESAFDDACKEFINVINYAAQQNNIPLISIKITGIARFSLLEKLDELMQQFSGDSIFTSYTTATNKLSHEEKQELAKAEKRLHAICEAAHNKKVGVLIDAEESWIQSPVDALCILMMKKFNRNKCSIFNTIQLYRHDRLAFLKESYELALKEQFSLGAKLVRGAYMEKERARALEKNYPSPIQINKENSDSDYNKALEFCINNIEKISLIVASHNEHSSLYATQLMQSNGIDFNHPHIHFSQLYGMSDNITFNLAKAGCSVSKYLPFGPIEDVVPYLMRRARENSSVAGQTGRELSLIQQELKRRSIS
jgi:proline dehydrogenase